MKRRDLLRHLEAHGCLLKREGGEHSLYWNPVTGKSQAVPIFCGMLIALMTMFVVPVLYSLWRESEGT